MVYERCTCTFSPLHLVFCRNGLMAPGGSLWAQWRVAISLGSKGTKVDTTEHYVGYTISEVSHVYHDGARVWVTGWRRAGRRGGEHAARRRPLWRLKCSAGRERMRA